MLDYAGKGVYLLAVTSNPGSADLERRRLESGEYVYEVVTSFVEKAKQEKRATDLGLVVGLTNAGSSILEAVESIPLLIPGLGAQGGDVANLKNRHSQPDLVNASRGISYLQPEKSFATKAEEFIASLA